MRDEKPPKRAAFLYARRGGMEGASPSGHFAGCGVSDAPPRELTGGPGGAKDAWRHLGMYFSKLKEYTPRPLETTKGEARGHLLWKPSRGYVEFPGNGRGHFAARLRGTLGRESGAGCLRSFRALCFAGDEGDESLVDLEPAFVLSFRGAKRRGNSYSRPFVGADAHIGPVLGTACCTP